MVNNLFSKTFNIVKYNLVLVQPLLIFFLLLGIIISPLGGSSFGNPASIVIIFSILALFCAFWAGWFNMFHKSIEFSSIPVKSSEEKAINSFKTVKRISSGYWKVFCQNSSRFYDLCCFIFPRN